MWQRFFAGLCGAFAVLLAATQPSAAQTITTGTLAGTVTDTSGLPLNEVAVTAVAAEGGAARMALTDREGRYRIALLQPGTYTILVERLGHRPERIEQVPVRPGRRVSVDASIAPAPPPVNTVDTLRFNSDAGGSRGAASQWLSTLSLTQLPWDERDASEIAGLATEADRSLHVEGLPARLSTVTIDGIPYDAARHAALGRHARGNITLPINVIQSVELVTGDADVERGGYAGGALAIDTRRGSAQNRVQTFGSWSGSALRQSRFISNGDAASSMWGGLLLSGPIIRDTANYVVGIEARQVDTPLPRAWRQDDGLDASLLHVADSAFNVDLAQYTRPYALQTKVISGFGRFDWQIFNESAVSVRAGVGRISPPEGDLRVALSAVPEFTAQGTDLFLSATLGSRIAGKWAHELRGGLLRSNRSFDSDLADALPDTRFAVGGIRFGRDARLPGELQRTEATLDQSLLLRGTTHQLKVGVALGSSWHTNTFASTSVSEFAFGGTSQFAQSNGTFVQSTFSGAADVDFNILTLGAFVQDLWRAAPGLELTLGLRYDVATLPAEDVSSNQEWLAATGLSNNTLKSSIGSLSPRFSLTWDLGAERGWLVTATAGRYVADPDAALLSEALVSDGDLRVRRVVGNLGDWPSPSTQGSSRPALTMLARGFRPAQTDRATLGLSRRIGPATLHVGGTYRYTDYLPRRSDLNLFLNPVAHDQYGRPVFGSLVQIGSVLAAAPSNRRFTDFDRVSAISVDGWSRYWGVTARIETNPGAPLGFFASYTRSRTRDNWLTGATGALPQSQLSPFPADLVRDWREGTSDFDVPDRVSAGIELRPRMALQPRLLALYRYRSGYPFTPGFTAGVDANGDGADHNDPAYIDESVGGISEILPRWDCLRSQVSSFAARNSCRSDGVHSLNVRFGLNLLRGDGTAAELFVDGVNLIESEQAEPDRALYLIDPNGALVTDEISRVVTTPLIANPHFGTPLVRYGTGRLLRIGIQVSF